MQPVDPFDDDLVLNAPVRFGIAHHIPDIERMRDDGHTWKHIADHIGWDEATLIDFYQRYRETNPLP